MTDGELGFEPLAELEAESSGGLKAPENLCMESIEAPLEEKFHV